MEIKFIVFEEVTKKTIAGFEDAEWAGLVAKKLNEMGGYYYRRYIVKKYEKK